MSASGKSEQSVSTAPDTDKVPTPAEAELVKDWKAKNKDRVRPVCVKAERNDAGEYTLKTEHPAGDSIWAVLLMRSAGTRNEAAMYWLRSALIRGLSSGDSTQPPNETELSGAFAVLQEIAPKDEIEAMLVGQMIVTHSLFAIQARRVRDADNIPLLEASGTLLTKLQRTYVAQIEALQRYRGKGQQQVRVEHVHIHEGGQAIVGTVQAGGGPTKTEDQPHAPMLTLNPGEALPSKIQTVREEVPVASR